MHKVLKEIIGSSRGGFNRVIVRIHHSIVQQVDKIKGSMSLALSKKPRDFENASIPHWVESIFAPLFYNVSDRCFTELLKLYKRIEICDLTEECKDPWVRTFQGLPCVHEVAIALVERKALTPDDVHDYWKELIWEDSSTIDEITLQAKEVTQKRIREMWSKFTTGTLKQSTAYQIGELYRDLLNPDYASFLDQTETVKRKGRPPGARNKNRTAARDKSLVEHREKEAREFEKQKAKEKRKGKEQGNEGKSRGGTKKASSVGFPDVIGPKAFQSEPHSQDCHKQDATMQDEPNGPPMHLGVDFGVNNLDAFWIPYINGARDVRSDSHCGYRSLLSSFYSLCYYLAFHV